MTAARLAAWHLREAQRLNAMLPQPAAWLKRRRDEDRRFHIASALLVIAKSSGGNTRRQAQKLLGATNV